MGVGTLYSFCGKMGAGKSTQAEKIATETGGILICEDEWLAALYGDQINTFDDYLEYSSRLKALLKGHVSRLLETGADVVLDFPANTVGQRKWFRELSDSTGTDGKLIYIKASNETCLSQIATRRIEQPERAKFDTESVFNEVTSYFQEPDESEGFNIHVIDKDSQHTS